MIPSSLFRPALLGIGGVLLCVGLLLLVGCDGAGSKRASLYQRLASETGTWTIERLEGDNLDYESLRDSLYAGGVEIAFQDDDGRRTYKMTGVHSDGATTKLAEGRVGLPGDELLRMWTVNEQRSVTWQYEFEGSWATFEVRSGSRAFLNALFPGGGRDGTLEMTLAPDDG